MYDVEAGWEVAKVNDNLFVIRNAVNGAEMQVDAATWDKVRSGEINEQDLFVSKP